MPTARSSSRSDKISASYFIIRGNLGETSLWNRLLSVFICVHLWLIPALWTASNLPEESAMPAFRRYALVAFAAVLLCSLFAEGADVLESSKSVRILFASGKTVSGILYERPGSTIRVRLRLNEKP